MHEGTVKWFDEQKAYGFIRPKDGSKDVFVHLEDVRRSGYDTLHEKDHVEFEIAEDDQGRQRAFNITAYEPGKS
jgi:CspA family cold shock protein